MIHEIVTCDKCNPQDRRKAITRLPYPNEGRGIFEGPRDAAKDAGWGYRRIITGTRWVSFDKQDLCPDCLGEMEDKEDE